MGGFICGIAGAIDTRIHAVLISGGGVYDGSAGYFDSNPLPSQAPPYIALLPLRDRGAVLYAPNAERGPLLVINGLEDTVMDIAHHPPAWFAAQRERALALIGPQSQAAKNIFELLMIPGVGNRTSWVERPGMTWLNSQLHFGIWDAKTIAAEPTTHISEWVSANHVFLAPRYASRIARAASTHSV
ncbi:MAG: hypothetical protein M3O31_12430 [Acidobacteriota bacterium]|nr:hypothetical protein [Acidobacteriota bacterium]